MAKYASNRPTWVHDVEIYKNYLLIGFKNVHTGKVRSLEVVGERENLTVAEAGRLRAFMADNRTIGFNSRFFDLVIVYAAIEGWSVRDLKKIADDVIAGARSWDLEREMGFKIPRNIDHIDLIEVAPGKASLKIYNGRLHGKRMQDLPIEPDAVLTDPDIDIVYRYWRNDLDATLLLWSKLKDQLELRTAMSAEYGQDLRSKSDAQIAEAVIKAQVATIIGDDPQRPEIRPGTGYRYRTPEFIRFSHSTMNEVLDEIERATFRVADSGKIIMPKALTEAEVRIGNGIYRMGIGGLHSSEKSQAVIAGDGYRLIDRDVTSYYPFIIINQGLYPKHMGWAFLKVYKKIVRRRIKAKNDSKLTSSEIENLQSSVLNRNDDASLLVKERINELNAHLRMLVTTADTLKITINGSFGKFGSKWSSLYSPNLLIQVTLTGQLSLLMLICRLEDEGIEVVSANTDGIVIRCPDRFVNRMDRVIQKWEADTGFETEATEYAALYSRDVNNYIAVRTDGKVKTKGAYAKAGLMKNPTNEICIEAVIEHIISGKSLYKTVRECRDITKFVTVRTVKGGAVWGVKEVETERYSEKTGKRLKSGVSFDLGDAEYLGKAIRWYYSSEVGGSIHYKINGNRVPRSIGARPLMGLPDEFPTDIDYGFYVRECRSILEDIGYERNII